MAEQSTVPGTRKRPSNISRSAVVYPRKRAVTACSHCRQRKKKCDNLRPTCGYCAELQIDCAYDDHMNHSSFDPASLKIMDLLHETLQEVGDLRARVEGVLPVNLPSDRLNEDVLSPLLSLTAAETLWQSPLSTTLDANIAIQALEEPQADYLKIPWSRAAPDALLQWPVFEDKYPVGSLTFPSSGTAEGELDASSGIDELDDVSPVQLVENFLTYVHIKNPILQVESLRGYARRVSEVGFLWDGPSCLVAITCALGCISGPYYCPEMRSRDTVDSIHVPGAQSLRLRTKAESFHVIARRRIGLLRNTILASQCFFFSAVYCMYRLRPLEACTNFAHSSTTYQMYMKTKPGQRLNHESWPASFDQEDQEDRLYWSCFKSECELQLHIGYPESGITDMEYPNPFPAPPIIDSSDVDSHRREQEQIWYYYSTEISLRRIANRVLNALYRNPAIAWLDMPIERIVFLIDHFLSQISQCVADLPTPIRYDEVDLRTQPTEELPALVRLRILEIKCFLHRPLLFIATHKPLDDSDLVVIKGLIDDSIGYEFETIRSSATTHRHHGTWYACRAAMSSAFTVAAALKSRRINVPDEWSDLLELAATTLNFWEPEAADLTKGREIVCGLLEELEVLK